MYMLCEKNFKLTTIALCISFDWTLTNMSTSRGLGGGGGEARAASQGMFFGIFVLNRVSNLSFFVLIRVSIYQFLS